MIAVVNTKGGVGKTTLATNLASALALRGDGRVLCIDADPQQCAFGWRENRQIDPIAVNVVCLPTNKLHQVVPEHSRGYAWAVIDGPAGRHDISKSAMMAADLVVIPIQPSPYDVKQAQTIVDLFREVAAYREDLKAVFAINRKIVHTALGRNVAEALAEYDLPILKSALSQRVAFSESAGAGLAVLEYEPSSPAADELTALVTELKKEWLRG